MLVSMQHTTHRPATSQWTQNPNATAVHSIGLPNKDYEIYEGKKVNKKEEIENITDYFWWNPLSPFTEKVIRKEGIASAMSVGFKPEHGVTMPINKTNSQQNMDCKNVCSMRMQHLAFRVEYDFG